MNQSNFRSLKRERKFSVIKWSVNKLSKLVQQIRTSNGFCQYRQIMYPPRWQDERPRNTCPLCNQQFIVGDHCYMILGHKNEFPNTVIHQSCVDVDLLITTHALIKSYAKFKKVINENKGWLEYVN